MFVFPSQRTKPVASRHYSCNIDIVQFPISGCHFIAAPSSSTKKGIKNQTPCHWGDACGVSYAPTCLEHGGNRLFSPFLVRSEPPLPPKPKFFYNSDTLSHWACETAVQLHTVHSFTTCLSLHSHTLRLTPPIYTASLAKSSAIHVHNTPRIMIQTPAATEGCTLCGSKTTLV